jgi:CO dehydrogenase maturation factor
MKLMICGKGGCGKSTVSALLAAAMNRRGKQVFLVDADESNIGLYRMLGVDMPEPLLENLGGKKGFREKLQQASSSPGGFGRLFPEGMSLEDLPKPCIAISEGIRILSIGKIHHLGEGCACPMGNLFRMLFSSLTWEGLDLVIVDAAAGIEHFGRNLDGMCDHLLCVVDPSYESIRMAERIRSLAGEAGLPLFVLLNRVPPDLENELAASLPDIPVIARIPENRSLLLCNFQGRPIITEPVDLVPLCDALENPPAAQ